MAPRFVYPPLVEAVFHRTLGPLLDASTREQLRAQGIDLDARPDLVPGRIFHVAIAMAAAAAYPELDPEEAERRVGFAACHAYAEGEMGRMLLGPAPTFGPDGLLADAAAYFRTGMNYFEVFSTVVSPTRVDVRIRPLEEGKHFWGGVLRAAAEMAGAEDVLVTLEPAGQEARYVVSWARMPARPSSPRG